MKRFRFPLRSVATVRSLAEMRAREALGLAWKAAEAASARAAGAVLRLREFEVQHQAARAGVFHAADEVSFRVSHRSFVAEVERTAAEAAQAQAAMLQARELWLAARRELHVIESLETKAIQRHRREGEREEQAAMDERATLIAGRNAAHAA